MKRRAISPRANDPVSELLFAFILYPTQFRDIWNGEDSSPERGLAAAVLEGAETDLRKYRYARGRSRQRMYWQAYQWVASPDREWPFSFVNICDCLGLSPEAIRARLLRATDDRAEAKAA